MSESREDESFLARWSRRKQDVREGLEAADVATPQDAAHDVECHALDADEKSPAEDVARAPLPRIEDLTADSDITGFLKSGVPQDLQRLALRRTWSLDPTISTFIEVAENQYDWNKPDGVPGFGPLDPGTDIDKLLAQATGWVAEPEPDSNSADNLPRSSTDDAESAASFHPAPQQAQPPDVSAENADAGLTPIDGHPEQQKLSRQNVAELLNNPSDEHPAEHADQNRRRSVGADPFRRRHGGALPT